MHICFDGDDMLPITPQWMDAIGLHAETEFEFDEQMIHFVWINDDVWGVEIRGANKTYSDGAFLMECRLRGHVRLAIAFFGITIARRDSSAGGSTD